MKYKKKEKEIKLHKFNRMRPSVDVHYRPESLEEANLIFILQEPRGLLVNSLVEDIDTYVNNPNFCKYTYIYI